MNKAVKKEIYFHVGTGKTATTFLQYRVFPKFDGIYYIQRTRFKKAEKIIHAKKFSRYLISREFDQQLEQEVEKFSSSFPDAKPIIVFRRHDSYIASQYRRFVKNGFRDSFTDFFDLDHDEGYFKQQDLNYYHQIKILENNFNQKPMVLFYEDLKENPEKFIEKLALQMNVTIDLQKVNLKRKHGSYSEKQLKAILFLGKHVNMRKRRIFKNRILHFFWRFCLAVVRYKILYLAKLIPRTFFSNKPLIPENELEKVRDYYKKDWELCLAYAEK